MPGWGFTGLALGFDAGTRWGCRLANSRDVGAAGWQTALRTQGEARHLDFSCSVVSSHIESFDPKPAITKYGGKTIAETPHKDVSQIDLRQGKRFRRSKPVIRGTYG